MPDIGYGPCVKRGEPGSVGGEGCKEKWEDTATEVGPKAGSMVDQGKGEFQEDNTEKGAPRASAMRLALYTGVSDTMATGLCDMSVMEARMRGV